MGPVAEVRNLSRAARRGQARVGRQFEWNGGSVRGWTGQWWCRVLGVRKRKKSLGCVRPTILPYLHFSQDLARTMSINRLLCTAARNGHDGVVARPQSGDVRE